MGNPDVHTPNIDRLASEGVLFRRTLANTPVCCPARANILTGTYASRNGMVANDLRLRESEITLGNLLARQAIGLATLANGTWMGGRGFRASFHRAHAATVSNIGPPTNAGSTTFTAGTFGTDVPIIMTEYEPKAWTDLAIEFLYENQDQKQPFFLIVAPHAPHDPYIAPEEFMKMYDPQALSMRPNWVEGTIGGGRGNCRLLCSHHGNRRAGGEDAEMLRELGMEENTIVVFISDHGNMLGSHGAILKRKPWEESVCVPGIIRYPGKVSAGRRSDALLTHVDLCPTLLLSCQIAIPGHIQGADLSNVVLGKQVSGPESAYFQIFGPYRAGGVAGAWRGVVTARYMYARWESEPWLLYDLENDPYELKNLATQPSASSIRNEMDERLAQLDEASGRFMAFRLGKACGGRWPPR